MSACSDVVSGSEHGNLHLGSMVRNSLKLGWAVRIRWLPSWLPASFKSRVPSGSSKGLSRSKTVGLHRFALSKTTHEPFSMALVSAPSTHSNLNVAQLQKGIKLGIQALTPARPTTWLLSEPTGTETALSRLNRSFANCKPILSPLQRTSQN